MIGRCILALALIWLSAPAVQAAPGEGERFYLVIFGAESTPYRTRFTHTWATFIKTNGAAPVQSDTISWMPATLRIRVLNIRPEPGVNLTQEQTREWMRSVGMHFVTLGPYEIDRPHYERLLARKRELESGAMNYRALGGLTRGSSVSNCGQSYSRAHPELGQRYRQPAPEPGERGAILLAERYVQAGAFLEPQITHDWLLPLLGLSERAGLK